MAETDKLTVILGDFDTLCSEVDGTSRQNISKEIEDVTNLMSQLTDSQHTVSKVCRINVPFK